MPPLETSTLSISGELNATVVESPSKTPINVIPASSDWEIDCEWSLDPPGASLGGTWHLQAFLEAQGPAPELSTTPILVALDGRVKPATYTASIKFPKPQSLGGLDLVIYRVTVALTYRNPANKPGPIAAFVDLQFVQIFQDA
jgi:hypothetical protein